MVDAPASRVGQLERVLADKALDYMRVWDF